MSLAKAAQFLTNTAATHDAGADNPEARILKALEAYGTMPMSDVAKVSDLAPEVALLAVERLRKNGSVVVLSRPTDGTLYLGRS